MRQKIWIKPASVAMFLQLIIALSYVLYVCHRRSQNLKFRTPKNMGGIWHFRKQKTGDSSLHGCYVAYMALNYLEIAKYTP